MAKLEAAISDSTGRQSNDVDMKSKPPASNRVECHCKCALAAADRYHLTIEIQSFYCLPHSLPLSLSLSPHHSFYLLEIQVYNEHTQKELNRSVRNAVRSEPTMTNYSFASRTETTDLSRRRQMGRRRTSPCLIQTDRSKERKWVREGRDGELLWGTRDVRKRLLPFVKQVPYIQGTPFFPQVKK